MLGIFTANKVTYAGQSHSWQDCIDAILPRFEAFESLSAPRVMFAVADELEAVSIVAAGLSKRLDFGVVEAQRLNDDLRAQLIELGVVIVDSTATSLNAPSNTIADLEPDLVRGRISVLTSGTTGLPKLIPHTAESLNTFDRVRKMAPYGWFLPYQVGSYAWYQMVFLGLCVEDQTLILAQANDLMVSFEAALQSGDVSAVSSTPTFWRQAMFSVAPETFQCADIQMISMGGEIVDQAILDHLKTMFPQATIRHIYASSEAGAAIVVSDGQAGFSEELLQSSTDKPIAVRLDEGRLYIRSRYGNTGSGGDWIDTGDLIEQRDGRVFFCGRADNQMINVGGQKAFPATIEARLLQHPDVAWAQVVAKRAPLMGHLPAANVVLHVMGDPMEYEQQLTQFCVDTLPEYAVPRMWTFLDAIPIRTSLKS